MIANGCSANITLHPSMPYKPVLDFSLVAMATVLPHMLAIHRSVANDLTSFLAAGRKPGTSLAFGSYGIDTSNHPGGEQFVRSTGIGALHLPYTGGTQANTGLQGNRLQFMFANLPDMLQPVQTGQLRVIAVSADARIKEPPNVPTMAELGWPLVLSNSWYAVIVRPDVLAVARARARLTAARLAALARPEISRQLQELGFTVLAKPAATFAGELRRYADVYAEVIRGANIKVE